MAFSWPAMEKRERGWNFVCSGDILEKIFMEECWRSLEKFVAYGGRKRKLVVEGKGKKENGKRKRK